MKQDSPSIYAFVLGGAGIGFFTSWLMFAYAEHTTTDPQGLGPGALGFLIILPVLMFAGAVAGCLLWMIVAWATTSKERRKTRQLSPGDIAIVRMGKFTGKLVVILGIDETAKTAQVRFQKTNQLVNAIALDALDFAD